MNDRLDYDLMADKTDVLFHDYLDACAATPTVANGAEPTTWGGKPTSVPLVDAWTAYQQRLAAVLAEGGWTWEEFEAEVDRRALMF